MIYLKVMTVINENFIKIVDLLSDEQFHDGTSIGEKLNITRAAVWKAIKKLEQYDIELESIKGKGYRLTTPLSLLSEKKINAELKRKKYQIMVLEKVDSTNKHLIQYLGQSNQVVVCLAEKQESGKGRFSRHWYSPFGQNIYLSMLYSFKHDVSQFSGLSMIAALACCKAIETCCPLPFSLNIKWPNDIFYQGEKIAGILVELQAESHGFCHVIIGVGVNVNMEKTIGKPINHSWTSLSKILNEHLNRNQLAATLINTMDEYITHFSEVSFSHFMAEWRQRDLLLNKIIKVKTGQSQLQGTAMGINEQGYLQLKTQNNETKFISSGDTTILK